MASYRARENAISNFSSSELYCIFSGDEMCYNHFTLETKAGRQKSAIPGGRMDGARQHALQSRAVLRLKEDRTPSVLILGLRRGLFGWLKKFASLNGNSVRRSLAGVPHHSGRAEISRLCAYGRASPVYSRQD